MGVQLKDFIKKDFIKRVSPGFFYQTSSIKVLPRGFVKEFYQGFYQIFIQIWGSIKGFSPGFLAKGVSSRVIGVSLKSYLIPIA